MCVSIPESARSAKPSITAALPNALCHGALRVRPLISKSKVGDKSGTVRTRIGERLQLMQEIRKRLAMFSASCPRGGSDLSGIEQEGEGIELVMVEREI